RARAALDTPPGDFRRVPELDVSRPLEPARLEPGPRLERVVSDPRAPHPVEPERTLPVARAIPRVDVPVGQPPLDRIRLDEMLRRRLLAFLEVVDLGQPALADPLGQRRDQVLLRLADMRRRRLCEVELAERLFELRPDAVERRASVGRD